MLAMGQVVVSFTVTISFLQSLTGETEIEMLCPSQMMCHRTTPLVKATYGEDIPCCLPCSCHRYCADYGNCCPDARNVRPATLPLECYLPVVNSDLALIFLEDNNVYGDVHRYMTVVTCPETTQDEYLRIMCESKTPEFTEELVMVSDSDGHLFKNEFCAQCNGVETYTPWDLRLRTDVVIPAFMYSPTKPYSNFPMYMFWSTPPNAKQFERARCFRSIDTCNITGTWTVHESDRNHLEGMCNGVTMYYIHPDPFAQTVVYKNPFCYKCNTVMGLNEPQPFCKIYNNQPTFVVPYGFLAIIKHFSTEVERHRPQSQNSCGLSQIYDPAFKLCREVECPQLYIPIYGQCSDLFDKIIGGTSTYVLYKTRVSFEDDIGGLIEHFISRDPMKILDYINIHLTLSKHSCDMCEKYPWVSYFKEGNDSTCMIAFYVTYMTSEDCHSSFLRSVLKNASADPNIKIRVPYETTRLTFTVEVLQGNRSSHDLGQDFILMPSVANTEITCLDSFDFDFITPDTCPRVGLSVEEYDNQFAFAKPVSMPEMIDDGSGNVRYMICLDEYMSQLADGNKLFPENATTFTLLLLCISIVLVF